MFEVRAHIGKYREGGFLSYEEAARRAQTLASERNEAFVVNEITLRCIVRPKQKTATP